MKIFDISILSIINNPNFIYLNNSNINNCHVISTILKNLKQLEKCEIDMNNSSIENNKIINDYNIIKDVKNIKNCIVCSSFVEAISYPSNYYKLKLIIENKSSFRFDSNFKLLIKCAYNGNENNIDIELPSNNNNNKLYFNINLYNYDGKDDMKYFVYLILNISSNKSMNSYFYTNLDILKCLIYESAICFFDLLYPSYIPLTQSDKEIVGDIQNGLKINEIINYNIKDMNKLQLLLNSKIHSIWNHDSVNNDISLSI